VDHWYWNYAGLEAREEFRVTDSMWTAMYLPSTKFLMKTLLDLGVVSRVT
jgi:hypothetical protein